MSMIRKAAVTAVALVLLTTTPALADTPPPVPPEPSASAESTPTPEPESSPTPGGDPTGSPDAEPSATPSDAPTTDESPSPEPTPQPSEPAAEPRKERVAPEPSTVEPARELSVLEQYARDNGLGSPRAEPVSINGGLVQVFQKAVVTHHPRLGTFHMLPDAIRGKFYAAGGFNVLGFPTSNKHVYSSHWVQHFSNGSEIWQSSRGVYRVSGAPLRHYKSLNAYRKSALGMVTCDETSAHDSGRVICFAGGGIYYSRATGASDVWGQVYRTYRNHLAHLGLPIGATTTSRGVTVHTFARGQVVSTIPGGTHAIYGPLYNIYKANGGSTGRLKFPTSAQYDVTMGQAQKFHGGMIVRHRQISTRAYFYNSASVSVRRTTSADVRSTYRSGCPVGPASLRTLNIDYWDYEGIPRRGTLIVRDSRAADVQYVFDQMWITKFPVARMDNPNVFGGSDPEMMHRNNTSGFNCRRVVGNPYAMSPHAYGTAVDINTVQNPYRDPTGKWWPENGSSYILGGALNRTPMRQGMFNTSTMPVKAMESRGWFWGGRWASRDYHHFQR